MTVKVVQGLIGNSKPPIQAATNNATQAAISSSQSPAAVASAVQHASTEAVSVSIKNFKASSTGERIRDSKEAKSTADKVADQIRENSDSADVHTGLSASSGRPHLS